MNEQTTLKLALIFADPDQPRKYFAADKLGRLKQSINKYGIQQPLVVEKQSATHYDLIDGERRYRCAVELGIEEVPVIVTKTSSKLDKLIKQFHIQEQHEGWTSTEKANAIIALAQELKLPLRELCKELGTGESETERYMSFAQLIEKDLFTRAEIPLEHAVYMRRLSGAVKKLYQEEFEEDFARDEEKRFERALINRIADGVLETRSYAKLKDSFTKSPKSIKEFMDDRSITPELLFVKTKARGAYYLRNTVNNAHFMVTSISKYLESQDVVPSAEAISQVKGAQLACERFLRAVTS